jgi:hypothetical protein
MSYKIEDDADDITRREDANSSLRTMFYFYAKLQKGGHFTFEDMDDANITISFYELISLLRDFNVIPTLLSKEDIQFLWKVINLQSVKLGNGRVTDLDLDLLKELLARGAVLAYNRSGMRRLILNAGLMPSQSDLIEMFCRHMRLDDYSYVSERILTIGANRVKNQNRVANEGERNMELRKELREDINAKRVARAMKKIAVTESDDIDRGRDRANKIANAMKTQITGIALPSDVSMTGTSTSSSLQGAAFAAAGANISDIQERELLNFNSTATRIFDKYCSKTETTTSSKDGFQLCDGAFLDLGELRDGCLCVVKIAVRNNCPQEIQLDVIARGIQ